MAAGGYSSRKELGAMELEYALLNRLNRLAHEVSALIRRALECVSLLGSSVSSYDNPARQLVSTIRSLSSKLEELFDCFHPTSRPTSFVLPSTSSSSSAATSSSMHAMMMSHENARHKQLRLSEGLLKWMKKLVLKGVELVQEAKLMATDRPRWDTLERDFKVLAQSLVLDLREVLRLQHVIAGNEPEQHSSPSSPASFFSSDRISSSSSSSSAVSSPRLYVSESDADISTSMSSNCSSSSAIHTGTADAGGQRKSDLVENLLHQVLGSQSRDGADGRHNWVPIETGELGPQSRQSIDLGSQRLRRRAMLNGLNAFASSAAVEERSTSTSASYRRSRIVYGFQMKEGAMKLKVELQQDDVDARNDPKQDDISDEQFADMMIQFFSQMENNKAPSPCQSPPSVTDSAPALDRESDGSASESDLPKDGGSEGRTESKPTRRQMRMKEAKPRVREGRWYFCLIS